jgi:hypothetical protein
MEGAEENKSKLQAASTQCFSEELFDRRAEKLRFSVETLKRVAAMPPPIEIRRRSRWT